MVGGERDLRQAFGAILPELVRTLERHGHLSISDEVRQQLLEVSPATVDGLFSPLRHPHGLTTTKPGRLLKHQIPVRTFTEWTDVKADFSEADLVAHCGGATDGSFLYTLTLTDVATTWTECLPLLHGTQHGVVHAVQRARNLFPLRCSESTRITGGATGRQPLC